MRRLAERSTVRYRVRAPPSRRITVLEGVATVNDLDEDTSLGARVCVSCGHIEVEHALHDTELPGGTLRRSYCERCEDFHDFVPDPREL
jgi:hypothetical protein